MECSVGMNRASSGGLYPMEHNIILKSAIVQSEGSVDLKRCSSTTIQNLSVSLCAIEDGEAAGIFRAEIGDLRKVNSSNLLPVKT